MIGVGVCDKGRGLENIINIYKAWTKQTLDFGFGFLDCNKDPLPLPDYIPRDNVFHNPYDGPFNISFMTNYGIRHGLDSNPGCKYLQLIGSDCYPSSNKYFEATMSFMDEYDIVVPRMVRVSEKNKLKSFDHYEEFIACPEIIGEQYNKGLSFLKAEVFYELNGYDETYMLWGREDDDFILRAKQAGFRVKEMNDPFIVHDYHPMPYDRADFNSPEVQEILQINLMLRKMTMDGKLPIKRMPEDWGLVDHPRPNWELIEKLKARRKI